MPKPALVLALWMLIFTSSCSRLEIAVRWADTFAIGALEDHFEINSAHKRQLREKFQEAFIEVQRQEFPKLSKEYLSLAADLESNGFQAERMLRFTDDLRPIFFSAVARFEPMAQGIIEEQAKLGFEYFDSEFQERLKKDQRLLEKASQQAKRTLKKWDRWVSETVGDLTSEQEKSLRAFIQEFPEPLAQRLESRKSVYEAFVNLRSDPEKRRDFVKRFMTDWQGLQSPGYKAALLAHQTKIKGWIADNFASLTEYQKRRFIDHLKKRASELQELAAKHDNS